MTINIQNFELTCEDSVKLLGNEIDYQLNFDTHTSTIIILNVSRAIVLILRICKKGTFAFFNKLSYELL
jgi:hypothetical protein